MVEEVIKGETYYLIRPHYPLAEIEKVKIHDREPIEEHGTLYWDAKVLNTPYTQGVTKEMLYATKEKAEQAMKAKRENELEELKENLSTPKRAIKFLFGHYKGGEYVDMEKMELVKEKLDEYFNVDLTI